MDNSSGDNLGCQVEEHWRSACYGSADYEYEDKRYCILHLRRENKRREDFEKALRSKLSKKILIDFRGTFFPDGLSEFKGFTFDANAIFAEATFCGTANFSEARFSGERTDFSGALFSGELTDFSEAQFSGAEAFFTRAQFSGEFTNFSEAQFSGRSTAFSGAKFSGAETNFSEAQFSDVEAYFSGAKFSSTQAFFTRAQFSGKLTDFSEAQFSGALTNFSGAQFSGELTNFSEAQFSGKLTRFKGSTFKEKVTFLGTEENTIFDAQSFVEFDQCRIDKPELLQFNHVLLRPGWFINADVRKVDFTDVKWYGISERLKGTLQSEVKALEESKSSIYIEEKISSPYTLLAQACQRLAANAEENRDYVHASGFNYWAMDAQRKAKWGAAFAPWRLIWWYWALSGYGERTLRSAIWLVGILVGFAVLYMLVGHIQVSEFSLSGLWQAFSEALVYSLGVMSRQVERLSSSESTLLRSLVFIEGILGPLQVALFALALRRKFMRGKG